MGEILKVDGMAPVVRAACNGRLCQVRSWGE